MLEKNGILYSSQTEIRVLIVDDESYVCTTIKRWLEPEGYICTIASSVDDALSVLAHEQFELLISDITMPGKTGIDLLRIAKERFPNMAVLMATAIDNREVAIHALELGAFGYMIKPFDRNEFIINVVNAIERRRLGLISKEYESQLEREVSERTADIRQREEEMVLRLVWASEYRDDDTGEHIQRVGLLSAELARAAGWSPAQVDNMRIAAPMHDVGKIGVSDSVLLKPGKLTPEEFAQIKKHSEIGAKILGGSQVALFQLASEIALTHHEKWDGSGYPQGLAGEDIPESGRIVAIVDVYDALSSDRVYRKAFPDEKVMQIMNEGNGSHFDPRIFQCFLDVLPVFRLIQKKVKEGRA